MRKKKTTLALRNYNKPTPIPFLRIAMAIKGFVVSVGGTAYIMGNEKTAFVIASVGFALTEAINFISHDTQNS